MLHILKLLLAHHPHVLSSLESGDLLRLRKELGGGNRTLVQEMNGLSIKCGGRLFVVKMQ